MERKQKQVSGWPKLKNNKHESNRVLRVVNNRSISSWEVFLIMQSVMYLTPYKPITYPGVARNRYIITEDGKVMETGYQLRPFVNSYGYLQIRLVGEDGNLVYPLISRLVAYEFCLDNRNIAYTVDHRDCNKLNNNYSNLEWVTAKANLRRAYENKLFGFSSYKTNDQIQKLCKILEKDPNITYSNACIKAGIPNLNSNQAKGLCCDIIDRRYWTDISKSYDFSKRRRRTVISNDTKNQIKDLIVSGETVQSMYPKITGNVWGNADRKEKDRFRQIVNRIKNTL